MAFAATAISPIPGNYRTALADPQWRAAMAEEYRHSSTMTLGGSFPSLLVPIL